MNTLTTTAPQQGNATAWHDARVGKFTASTIGKLMTPPRMTKELQARADAGEVFFGDTALQLIAVKACERLGDVTDATASTRSMDRGTILEHAAIHLLGRKWKAIDHATFMPLGHNAGATPDGLTEGGAATVDIKCPESFADLLRFDLEVKDGDFASLEAWDRGYAWQIMTQAKAAGVRAAWLVYFTDRLPLIPLTEDERDEVQAIMDWHLERRNEEKEYPWHYAFASNGFAFAAKRFTLTDELSERIDRTLAAAEVELANMLTRTTINRNTTPTT